MRGPDATLRMRRVHELRDNRDVVHSVLHYVVLGLDLNLIETD